MKGNVMWRGSIGALSLDGPILRKESFESLRDVSAMLSKAESVYQEQVKTAEQSFERSRTKGYQAGYAAGQAAAFAESVERLGDASEQARRLACELADIVTTALDGLLDVQTRQAIARNAILEAVELARRDQRARLLVASQDLEFARQLLESNLGSGWHEWMTVEADPSAAPGDVVLQSDGSIVDARIQTRFRHWQAAVAALIEQRIRQAQAEGRHDR